ncbi:MAG: hypothetical protein HQL26_10785 [Candidatus Omnitrophica bacterium]|nr:hypothetical protein [Candidatus Omnitrophota bacterium]
MPLQTKKLILEIYGLVRMTLGIAQLTGLTAGYFFWEWAARNPPSGFYVIPQDTVLLVCLAVFVRSIWHIGVGIGLARVQGWTKYWLMIGWPLMLLVTYGIVYALWADQTELGRQGGLAAMLVGWKVAVLMAWALGDIFFVRPLILQVDQLIIGQKDAKRMEGSKITAAFFGALVFIIILLFAARPLRSGFHQGFYKVSGQKNIARSSVVSEPSESPAEEKNSDGPMTLPQPKTTAVEKTEQAGALKTAVIPKVLSEKTTSVSALLGYAAGICVIVGILLWLYLTAGLAELGSGVIWPLAMMAIGFFLWAVYGFGQKLFIVGIMNFIACIVCLIVIIKVKNKN